MIAEPETQLTEKLPEQQLLKLEEATKDRQEKESPVLGSISKAAEPAGRKETAEKAEKAEKAAAQPKQLSQLVRKREVKEEL